MERGEGLAEAVRLGLRATTADADVIEMLRSRVDSAYVERCSTDAGHDSCIQLLGSILGQEVVSGNERTGDGLPTLGFLNPTWSWQAIVLITGFWTSRADVCDSSRTIVPAPPTTTPGPPPPTTADYHEASAVVFTNAQRDHIRAAYSLSRHNPLHLLGRLAIQWQRQQFRWVDHLTGMPMDFFAPPGPGATTIIAHRVHGLPFSFGWRVKVPTSLDDWLDVACNTITELRITNFRRTGRPGACLFDFLDRWKSFASAFSDAGRAAHAQGLNPALTSSLLFLTPEEVAAAQQIPLAMHLNPLADPLTLVNRVEPAEAAAWWREIWGADIWQEDGPVAPAPPPPGARTRRQRLLLARVSRLKQQEEPMPWWVREYASRFAAPELGGNDSLEDVEDGCRRGVSAESCAKTTRTLSNAEIVGIHRHLCLNIFPSESASCSKYIRTSILFYSTHTLSHTSLSTPNDPWMLLVAFDDDHSHRPMLKHEPPGGRGRQGVWMAVPIGTEFIADEAAGGRRAPRGWTRV